MSEPTAILDDMRIRTNDGPPLPAEIAAHTARTIALVELLRHRPAAQRHNEHRSKADLIHGR
jgi:hypothetical protein